MIDVEKLKSELFAIPTIRGEAMDVAHKFDGTLNVIIAAARKDERERIAKSEEYWRGVYDVGELTPDKIMDELADFHMVVDHCSKVYDHFTNGRISKPQTLPSEVIAVAEDIMNGHINEAVKEARKETLEEAAQVCAEERLINGGTILVNACEACADAVRAIEAREGTV